MNVLKHVAPPSVSVRLMPPSKKSGGTTVLPTALPFAVSHFVVIASFSSFGPEFVVAQMSSPVPAALQSPPLEIGNSSHTPGSSGLSMQLFVPSQRYASMLLTPPPFVNADTTRTSPSRWLPAKSTAPPVDE